MANPGNRSRNNALARALRRACPLAEELAVVLQGDHALAVAGEHRLELDPALARWLECALAGEPVRPVIFSLMVPLDWVIERPFPEAGMDVPESFRLRKLVA